MPDVPTVLLAPQQAPVRHRRLGAPTQRTPSRHPACRWCRCPATAIRIRAATSR